MIETVRRGPEPQRNADMPCFVDAHHHVWDLSLGRHPWLCNAPPIRFRYGDYAAIRKSYLLDDFLADVGSLPLIGSIYVEAEWEPTDPAGETRWISQVSEARGLPNAIVAQAWLDREDVADVLTAQAAFPAVRSVRHKPTAAGSAAEARRGAAGSMDDPRWRDGFALLGRHRLCFDLQTPWWHFDAALALARDFPETTIIVNHTGLPADRSPEALAAWRRAVDGLSAAPNVRMKISGLGVPGQPWTVEANRAIVFDAITAFEPSRCMFASNYPVDSLIARYATIFTGFAKISRALPAAARRRLFSGTAVETYGLSIDINDTKKQEETP